jgi:hypothetical protein
MVTDPKARIAPLISLLYVYPRAPGLRSELRERLDGVPAEEIVRQCIDGLHEWLGVTCAVFFHLFPSDAEPVKSMARREWFALTIVHLEALVNAWTRSVPSREERAALEVVIDLLCRVEAKREEMRATVKNELFASYFLCCALWNQRRGQPLLGSVQDEVFTSNDLYPSLVTKTRLDEIVEEVRCRVLA